jgi:hypothetical protein
MNIEAMKQALEALDSAVEIIPRAGHSAGMQRHAADALRQAIAKEWVGLSYADIEACLPDTGVKFGDGTALFVYRLEQILKERNT